MKRSLTLSSCIGATLLLLAVAPAGFGAERYVATAGNNAGGNMGTNINSPLATIAQAVTLSAPGDTIWVRGGTYNLSAAVAISASKSGTAAAPFRLWAYPGETPVLEGANAAGGSRGIELRGNYWHLKGLTVQNAKDNGVMITGSNNIVEQFTVHGSGDSGVNISGSSSAHPANNLILNTDSYLNADIPDGGENADGFAAKYQIGAGNVFRGNRAWGNSDDGWDFWNAAYGILVEDCWSYKNGYNVWGIGSYDGDGNAYKLGQDAGPHILKNALAWGNVQNGIDVNGNGSGLQIFNCTSYNNTGFNFQFDEALSSHILRNNISLQGGEGVNGVNVYAGVTHDHNSWNAGFAAATADFLSLDDSIATGPRLPDGSLPVSNYLRLAPTSPLLNAGVDVGLPFTAAAPDLGAFESSPPAAFNEADFNQDGAVNALDLAAWRMGFGAATGAMKPSGDADADGDVDGGDFLIWQRHLGATTLTVAVPEPTSLHLIAVAALALSRLKSDDPRLPRAIQQLR